MLTPYFKQRLCTRFAPYVTDAFFSCFREWQLCRLLLPSQSPSRKKKQLSSYPIQLPVLSAYKVKPIGDQYLQFVFLSLFIFLLSSTPCPFFFFFLSLFHIFPIFSPPIGTKLQVLLISFFQQEVGRRKAATIWKEGCQLLA